MHNTINLGNIISWLFGLAFLAIGIINMFWGNDPFFGVFIGILSFAYFSPVNAMVQKKFGFAIPVAVKIFLGAFITWAALGVGELFDKIDLMLQNF